MLKNVYQKRKHIQKNLSTEINGTRNQRCKNIFDYGLNLQVKILKCKLGGADAPLDWCLRCLHLSVLLSNWNSGQVLFSSQATATSPLTLKV